MGPVPIFRKEKSNRKLLRGTKPEIFALPGTGNIRFALTHIDIWLDYNCYLIYKHVFNKEHIQKRTVDLF